MQEKPWNLAHCTIAPGRHVVGLGPIEVGDEVEYQVTNGSVRIRRVGCTSTPALCAERQFGRYFTKKAKA